jgi:hypothetical protein
MSALLVPVSFFLCTNQHFFLWPAPARVYAETLQGDMDVVVSICTSKHFFFAAGIFFLPQDFAEAYQPDHPQRRQQP